MGKNTGWEHSVQNNLSDEYQNYNTPLRETTSIPISFTWESSSSNDLYKETDEMDY